jgi:UPF0716 protein FxsA
MAARRIPIGSILFLLFSAFTLLELWVLVLLTRATSLEFTILLTIVSAIVGASLAKRQGLAVMIRMRHELNMGRIPARPLADGVMILLGGALLITPGLITDVLGMSTLIPFCRNLYAKILIRWAKRHFLPVGGAGRRAPGGFQFYTFSRGSKPGSEQESPSATESTPRDREPPEVHVLDPDHERRVREWRQQVREDDDSTDEIVDAEFEDQERP